MLNYLWLIPVVPFIGFLLNGLFGRRAGKPFVSAVAAGASLIAAILGTAAALQYQGPARYVDVAYNWITSGNVNVDLAFQLDPLSIVMLMVVTWVGFLIHVYSIGYMAHEEGYWRYFAYLNLFLAMMLVLILGSSYLVMFIGWEGVGLCSYLLIGFYYETDYAPAAGKKAFIVNRIGDFGFLVAMFLMFAYIGSVDFAQVSMTAAKGGLEPWLLTSICLLLFLGACGKSAQIPLYVWLPDAMAGPTPVSALIHAATMVTAGVYMVVRSNALYRLAPDAMMVVALIGACTALFAATIGIRQWDIKKVLAYSTVSQLGFMFIGVGVGAFTAGLFHVVTHAFFKACLFLGSGSVIHAMGGEQDMRKMGGLRGKIPITFWTFVIATYAITGLPFGAGFFSKDAILGAAYVSPYFPKWFDILIYAIGTIAAFCTAFYMTRLVVYTFFGSFRGTHDQEHHLHESPLTMTVPLIILAALSAFGGFLGPVIGRKLEPIFPEIAGRPGIFELEHGTEITLMIVASLVAALGVWIAWLRFSRRGLEADAAFEHAAPAIAHGMENKWYVDEFYGATIVRPLEAISQFFWKVIDAIIDGIAAMLGFIVRGVGDLLRFFQTGNVRNYALMFFVAVVVFVWVLA